MKLGIWGRAQRAADGNVCLTGETI